jgi:hypothetical protein
MTYYAVAPTYVLVNHTNFNDANAESFQDQLTPQSIRLGGVTSVGGFDQRLAKVKDLWPLFYWDHLERPMFKHEEHGVAVALAPLLYSKALSFAADKKVKTEQQMYDSIIKGIGNISNELFHLHFQNVNHGFVYFGTPSCGYDLTYEFEYKGSVSSSTSGGGTFNYCRNKNTSVIATNGIKWLSDDGTINGRQITFNVTRSNDLKISEIQAKKVDIEIQPEKEKVKGCSICD